MPAKDCKSFFIYVIYNFTSRNQSISVQGGGEGALCEAECEAGQNFHV